MFDSGIARGDMLLDEDEPVLKSELPGVSDEAWTQFVRGMVSAKLDAVSDSNALGMFEMSPRRLADLGVVKKLSRTKSPKGRTIWTAAFVPPMTPEKFLKSPDAQYRVFASSMKDYARRIDLADNGKTDGAIPKSFDMSLSGALAILHKAGPAGLKSWDDGERFSDTEATYDKVAGIF